MPYPARGLVQPGAYGLSSPAPRAFLVSVSPRGTGNTPVVLTLSAMPVPGDVVLVSCATQGASGVSSITGAGAGWSRISQADNPGGAQAWIDLWMGTVGPLPSVSITVTTGSGANATYAVVYRNLSGVTLAATTGMAGNVAMTLPACQVQGIASPALALVTMCARGSTTTTQAGITEFMSEVTGTTPAQQYFGYRWLPSSGALPLWTLQPSWNATGDNIAAIAAILR